MTTRTTDTNKAPQPNNKTHQTKGAIWRWFKRLFRIIFYIPLGLLISLAIIIGTNFGSHIAVKIADILVPGLEVSYVSGKINNRLQLDVGNWQMSGVKVETTGLILDWNPMCLVQKQLCVNELSAAKVNVEIDTDLLGDPTYLESETADTIISRTSDNEDNLRSAANQSLDATVQEIEDNQEIVLPFGIKLAIGALSQVTVRVNDMDFNAAQLNLSAEWQSTGIRAQSIYAQDLLVSIPLSSSNDNNTNAAIVTKENPPKPASTSKTINQASGTNVITDDAKKWAMANLPEVFMPIPVYVESLKVNNGDLILGPREDHFTAIALSGSYQTFLINIEELSVSHSYGSAELNGHMSLSADYPMDFELDINLDHVDEVPGLKGQQLNITVVQGFKQLKSEISGHGQFEFDLSSSIALADPKVPYSIALQSKKIQWPITKPEYIVTNIKLKTHGNVEQQQVDLQTHFNSNYHPVMKVNTLFEHQNSTLDFSALEIESKMGNAAIDGKLVYGDTFIWDTNVITEKLDISQLQLDLEQSLPKSNINGQFSSNGQFSLANAHWSVGISDAELNGDIETYPLTVDGNLALNHNWYLSSTGLNIHALKSSLYIEGEVDKRWSLTGDLAVPDLSLWHQDARGQINSDITVTGESEHPNIEVSLLANGLKFSQLSLEKLNLTGHYKPLDNQAFSAQLSSDKFSYDTVFLDSINVQSNGDLNQQSLNIETQGELGLTTSIKSQFDDSKNTANAQISRLNLQSKLGEVSLEKPLNAQYDISKTSGQITPFCLTHASGKLCAVEPIKVGMSGQAKMEYAGDLGVLISPWLPESIKWHGPSTLASEFKWFEEGKPTGQLELDLTPGTIDFKTTNSNEVSVGYKSFNIQSLLNDQFLKTTIALESYKIASLDANLTVSVTPDRTIDGKLALHQIDLKALAQLLPELETLEGIVSSNLNLSGTLADPQASGDITLRKGSILATANPTLIEDVDLNLTFGGKQAQIDGELKMGKGLAYIDGQLDWLNKQLKGNFDIKGKDLAVIQPPLAILSVGTDLNISFTDHSVDVKGDINVPTGHITIVQLPEGGVAVSKDVVFKDSLATQTSKATPLAVSAEVNLNIGDDLKVDGMGLDGKLLGKLELKQSPFRPPLLFGEIKVIDGSYKFMGQTLKIKAGEMQFIGPIDVPNLNIEAAREIKEEDVIAGVRITGTPMKPIVNLFSNPAKEQAEILNYIVRGTGLNSNDVDQNSGLMMGAALTLSNQIGGGAIGNIGNTATGIIEKIGFSNVQLDANDDGRFAISGFIGEDLMVKYGIGVFNPGYEMTVRYYLLSQLYLETVSGTIEQSLDIYYSFDL